MHGFICDHPPERVTADLLEGDLNGGAIQWCQICGAYRRVIVSDGRKTPKHYVSPWTLPQQQEQSRLG